MERVLLRPSEAARLLSVGRSSIYALMASGAVPSVRLGRSLRIPASAIRELGDLARPEPATDTAPARGPIAA